MSAVLTRLRRHGTAYGYDQGCRCDQCSRVKMAKRKATRDCARAENRPSYQRELLTSRRLKEGYHGTCKTCGAATGYDGHNGRQGGVRCKPCANRAMGYARRGTGPRQHELFAFLADGPRRPMEIRVALGISSVHTSVLLNAALKLGLIERPRRGVYALVQPSAEDGGQPSREKG